MPPIKPELLDELLKDYKKPDDLLGQDGLLQQLTKALVERALDGELTHHRQRTCVSAKDEERAYWQVKSWAAGTREGRQSSSRASSA